MLQVEEKPQRELDVGAIRKDFPILAREVNGRPLVYLDNAATSQKPLAVVDALRDYYLNENANIHRGVHHLSMVSTEAYDRARETVRRFLNAGKVSEVVFTRGATEAINLVASSFGEAFLSEGDEIIVSALEHHANLVPWQLACERHGAKIRVIPLDHATMAPDFGAFSGLLNEKTRILALSHASNALGTRLDVGPFIQAAHEADVPVLLDACQSVPHGRVDVTALDCDFLAFSGHKVVGPTGIGVLYGKSEWLEKLPPYQGGGDMITKVRFEGSSFRKPPERFEAGTPHIAGAIGLAAALDYVEGIGIEAIEAHEATLEQAARERLTAIEGVTLFAGNGPRLPVFSFTMKDLHPHDLGTFLDTRGIAIRAGHHCAQPLMRELGVPATARASFAFYNTLAEVEILADALEEARRFFA